MKFNFDNLKTNHLLLVILVIIFLFPLIYKIPAFNDFFDYSNSGEIGDTIGGITSPFINGL